MRRTRVDFITNIAPHYRNTLWCRLLQDQYIRPKFVFGEASTSSITTIDFSAEPWCDNPTALGRIRNIYIGKVLVWQRGVLKHILRTDAKVIVMLGQVYVASTWIVAILARTRGIRVVFWGHGMYGRESPRKKWLIMRFLSLANVVLVYGERARDLLTKSGLSSSRIRAVYNSLDYAKHLAMRGSVIDPRFYANSGWFHCGSAPVLLFVGRLTPQKSLDELIDAVVLLSQSGNTYNLVLVGDGPAKKALEIRAASIRKQVHFVGACYDEELLGRLIANADLCVSPGEVGLTAIHALSFGTPVCTHDAMEHQMPEAEAVIDGMTGTLFARQTMDIAGAISRWFALRRERIDIRLACYDVIDRSWNTENQALVIRRAVVGDG